MGGWIGLDPSIFESTKDLASFIGMLITIIGVIWKSATGYRDAFNQVRRCHRLARLVYWNISSLKEDLIKITRCLSREEDEGEIKRILYEDSNYLEDLRDFADDGCPDIDVKVRKETISLMGLGIAYIIVGFMSGNFTYAFIFSILGLIPLYRSLSSGYEEVRKFTLALDDLEDKYHLTTDRINRLKKICADR